MSWKTFTSAQNTPLIHSNKLFVFGLGYTGRAVAHHFLEEHKWDVAGTCRSEGELKELRSSCNRIAAYIYDNNNADNAFKRNEELALAWEASHLLVTIPPVSTTKSKNGDITNSKAFPQGLDPHVINSMIHASQTKSLQWVGYISSTSVYGDHHGAVVNEDSSLQAFEGKGLARIQAEQAWTSLWQNYGVPVHIFRCGGIYGPNRNVIHGFAQNNQQLKKSRERRQSQQFTARIHVQDVCRILYASAMNPRPGVVYNVVDDDPASRQVVEEYAWLKLQSRGISFGKFGKPQIRRATNDTMLPEKRVSNKRVKQDLGIDLRFPTYREGLDVLINDL